MRPIILMVGAVLVAALSISASAQTWNRHPSPDQHDPYTTYRNKDGVLCCNGHDCRRALDETVFDILPDGGYRIRANKEGIPEGTIIPEGKVVPEGGPDGNWHICMSGSWNGQKWNPMGGSVRCLMIPQGGM